MKWRRQRNINTVLFDLGGVLATDVAERILFDRQYGLAPRGWLARRRWAIAATRAWNRVALEPEGTADQFWSNVSRRVGQPLTTEQAEAVQARVLQVTPQTGALIGRLAAAGIRVGLVTDNTPYWYSAQMAALHIEPLLDPGLIFTSFDQGVTKRHGLYRRVAQFVAASHALVIEDRLPLRRAARAAGFHVARYHIGGPVSLEHVLQEHGLLPGVR